MSKQYLPFCRNLPFVSFRSLWMRSLLLSVLALVTGCKNPEEELHKALTSRIETVEKENLEQVETIISEAYYFLNKFPNSKYAAEITKSITDLRWAQVEEIMRMQARLQSISYKSIEEAQEAPSSLLRFWDKNGQALAELEPRTQAHIEAILQMKKELLKLDEFFHRDQSTLEQFNEECDLHPEWEQSSFPAVRNLWIKMYGKRQRRLAEEGLFRYAKTHSEDILQLFASNICERNFKGFELQSMETVELKPVSEVQPGYRLNIRGIFRAYLLGAFIGYHRGTVKIEVWGDLTSERDAQGRPNGRILFHPGDFSILERTGDL